MRHLIVGATGQVGEALSNVIDDTFVWKASKSYKTNSIKFQHHIDIAKPQLMDYTISDIGPDVIWFPAALTNVDEIEKNNREGYITNVYGVRNVIRSIIKLRRPVPLIFYSTDYIFDGTEGPYSEIRSDDINVSQYGKQKQHAENLIIDKGKDLIPYIIVRTSWVYGPETKGKNFAARLIKSLQNGIEVKVPYDEIGTPTYAPDLAKYSFEYFKLLMSQCEVVNNTIRMNNSSKIFNEIINIAGTERLSKYHWALDIAKTFDLDSSLIVPIQSGELNRPAERPLESGLDITKLTTNLKSISTYKENLLDFKIKMIERLKNNEQTI